MLVRITCLTAGLLAGVVLSGCGSSAAIPRPTPIPTPLPTPTVSVGFVVQITPPPTTAPKPRPRPSPTRFVPPHGSPYLELVPAAGPPVSRTIIIRGGALPHSAVVDLVWSALGHGTGVGTTAATSARGTLRTRFTVPASPPGTYQVLANVNGVPYASARYRVVSLATLAAKVVGTGDNERMSVHGSRFLPDLRVVLIAYSVAKGPKPVVVGSAQTSASGRLAYSGHVSFSPGQYVLRAWSTSGFSSQMAETFFEVVF